jgi:alpha-D-ribose 1-methylphosphonate 5-triphosphate synthase subunit PhnG
VNGGPPASLLTSTVAGSSDSEVPATDVRQATKAAVIDAFWQQTGRMCVPGLIVARR